MGGQVHQVWRLRQDVSRLRADWPRERRLQLRLQRRLLEDGDALQGRQVEALRHQGRVLTRSGKIGRI